MGPINKNPKEVMLRELTSERKRLIKWAVEVAGMCKEKMEIFNSLFCQRIHQNKSKLIIPENLRIKVVKREERHALSNY